jgi:hypothetical protein
MLSVDLGCRHSGVGSPLLRALALSLGLVRLHLSSAAHLPVGRCVMLAA